MSDVEMVILNSGEEQGRLKNFLFTGIKDRDVKIFLSSIGFQLKSDPTKVTLVNSDNLEKYLTINKIGGNDDRSSLSFDDAPYTLVDRDVGKNIFVDFDKNFVTEVETFSFELVIDISNGQFCFHFPTIHDPLDLFEDIAGASFSFIKTDIKD